MSHTIQFFCLNLVLFGCTTGNKTELLTNPNEALVKTFGLNSKDIIYQYYQKFGFTDICEEIRIISKAAEPITLEKILPVNQQDIDLINKFSNKTDSFLAGQPLSIIPHREHFIDIELNYFEYKAMDSISVGISKGSYQIEQTEFESRLTIYDVENGLIFIEVHKCDSK